MRPQGPPVVQTQTVIQGTALADRVAVQIQEYGQIALTVVGVQATV